MNPALLSLRLSALQGLVRPNFVYAEHGDVETATSRTSTPNEAQDHSENVEVDVDWQYISQSEMAP